MNSKTLKKKIIQLKLMFIIRPLLYLIEFVSLLCNRNSATDRRKLPKGNVLGNIVREPTRHRHALCRRREKMVEPKRKWRKKKHRKNSKQSQRENLQFSTSKNTQWYFIKDFFCSFIFIELFSSLLVEITRTELYLHFIESQLRQLTEKANFQLVLLHGN